MKAEKKGDVLNMATLEEGIQRYEEFLSPSVRSLKETKV